MSTFLEVLLSGHLASSGMECSIQWDNSVTEGSSRHSLSVDP